VRAVFLLFPVVALVSWVAGLVVFFVVRCGYFGWGCRFGVVLLRFWCLFVIGWVAGVVVCCVFVAGVGCAGVGGDGFGVFSRFCGLLCVVHFVVLPCFIGGAFSFCFFLAWFGAAL